MNDTLPAALSRLGEVTVRLAVELGRAELPLREVLRLGEDSTIALDRMTDELLDLTANGRVIARGEVVVERGRFALRIVSLVGDEAAAPPPDADAHEGAAPGNAAPPPEHRTEPPRPAEMGLGL